MFSFDAHLRQEEEQLPYWSNDRTWERKHGLAAQDILRDLQRHGYLQEDHHALVDALASATVTLTFEASAGAGVTIPAGTRVRTMDASCPENGDTVFTTDAALVLAAGASADVAATAEHPGAPYNVRTGELEHLVTEIAEVESVTNGAAASGGVDHQLTRATVYRVLEMVMIDLMQVADDTFDARRRLYKAAYKEELDRHMAAGLDIDTNADGASSEEEKLAHGHGFHRFRRS